jgi:hypothetical protein
MSSTKASTKVDVVTVEANVEGGVPTGVTVRADDMFTINASGIAGYAGQTGPMTLPDGSRFIGGKFAGAWYDPAATSKGVPIGMLIARVGSGPWLAVGSNQTLAPQLAGEVYLAYNDNPGQYANNVGEYFATVYINS